MTSNATRSADVLNATHSIPVGTREYIDRTINDLLVSLPDPQKLSPVDSARLGAWLCGRAAELAIFHAHESVESLAATDIPRHLGVAFKQLLNGSL